MSIDITLDTTNTYAKARIEIHDRIAAIKILFWLLRTILTGRNTTIEYADWQRCSFIAEASSDRSESKEGEG